MKHQTINRSLNNACYRLSREVREHPLLTIGVAVGVGALLGALARQASATPRSRKNWMKELVDGFSARAHHTQDDTRRAGRLAAKEFHAAASRAAEAFPDVNVDHLVRRSRRWLRTKLV